MMNFIFYYIQSFIPWESDELVQVIRLGRCIPLECIFYISNKSVLCIALAHYICSTVKTYKIRRNQVLDLIDILMELDYINAARIRRLIDVFDREYAHCLYQPNTCIGIIASTSVSESATQNVLNAFHYSGTTSGSQCSMSVGLPRILEILSVTKKQKITNLTLVLNIKTHDLLDVYRYAYKLEYRTVKDFITSYSIYYGINPGNFWVDFFRKHISRTDSTFINFTVDINMNMYDMYKHGVSLHNICSLIQTEYLDIYCIFSPDRYATITLMFVDCDENIDIAYIQFVLTHIFKIYVCGVPDLHEVFPVNKNGQYIIRTNGGNLRGAIANTLVNGLYAISNNIWETHNILGIEACRELLIRELKSTFSQSGIVANEQHIELLVDVMTHSGIPKPVSRHGVDTDSFIASACFEESLSMLLNAAINGMTDNTKSESASILLGNPIHTGSGRGIDLFLKPVIPTNNSVVDPIFLCEDLNNEPITIGTGSWIQ